SVNESILTGESLAVPKDKNVAEPLVFKGTTVTTGMAIITVTHIGNQTRLGQIGKSLEAIQVEKTPLEKQINNFVKKMMIVGLAIFIIVWAINYFRSGIFIDSLLKALTLAMSILPEEIPVAFATFMAMGAWRLMKMGVAVKQIKTVETLGSASVICTDKTGTLTENKMSLAKLFTLDAPHIVEISDASTEAEMELINMAMWASEPMPFDPMEIALHQAYANLSTADERADYQMVHEYPLGGKPPMMTHVFSDRKNRIIAAKGAPEAIIKVCDLTELQEQDIYSAIEIIANEGYRVLGVAESLFEGDNFPKLQQDLKFVFKGIVAFYDPPKENIPEVLNDFYKAGVVVKIITGDNKATTSAIAKQIGLRGYENAIIGSELMLLSPADFQRAVQQNSIFCRMFPEAKLRIVEALKADKNIVAMTGDGVNDGPALKAANIGIAMGKKGTEIAKQASALVLLEDDLSKMVDAIAMGRRIYTNLKKAIQYIISIHIPIILTVFIPLALGWTYPNIFSPIHIIFLELIMGPTCSIVYENEPIEKNTLEERPRPFTTTFFNLRELATSIAQGLAITLGTLTIYQYAVSQTWDEATTRAMVFATLITANIFLTLVNRSFLYSIFTTLKYKNNLIYGVIGITILINTVILFWKPLADFFDFNVLTVEQTGICILVGFISVVWYEIVKYWKRIKQKTKF
ncbi:MAG TPA: cation-translocating P-type ATPase, partial [Arenibacter sp.]|nr:cation-translocating P-type ATPase [Arenibacter sp.]